MSASGVLYIVWGEFVRHELHRSIESVERIGLPYIVKELEPTARLIDKARMYEWSPFEETLFLDTDTVVLGDLGFGFEMAARHGVALALAPASLALRQQTRIQPGQRPITHEILEYNTGVIFFKKAPPTERLFQKWHELAAPYGRCDQWGFAQAIYETGFNPFVLPANWNYRYDVVDSAFFGPLKIWHARSPVPRNTESWNAQPPEFGRVMGDMIVPGRRC